MHVAVKQLIKRLWKSTMRKKQDLMEKKDSVSARL